MGAVQDSYITVAWLVLLVVLLVIEIITVGLTTIWGAGGALAALILNILDVPFAGQVVTFFVVTILLLVFTRPFAMRFINTRRLKTNYEGIIGKTIRISQKHPRKDAKVCTTSMTIPVTVTRSSFTTIIRNTMPPIQAVHRCCCTGTYFSTDSSCIPTKYATV